MPLSSEALDEFTIVESMYLDCVVIDSERSALLTLADGDVKIRFIILDNYPTNAKPIFEISAPSFTHSQRIQLTQILEGITAGNFGQCVLVDCINACIDFVSNLHDRNSSFTSGSSQSHDLSSQESYDHDLLRDKQMTPLPPVPEIYSTDTISDRKSVFQAHVARVHSREDVDSVLSELKKNHKIQRATHNMVAYRIQLRKGNSTILAHDCEDDGETGAGQRLSHLLDLMHVNDLVVVVTRWYGGIHLGPDRFRHINNIARRAVVESTWFN